MKIALFHGYKLTGSGSNEYTRYLSRALADAGHEVHVLCREPHPETIAHVTAVREWDREGRHELKVERASTGDGSCTVHVLPHAEVRPVYLTDKQRVGNVKAFSALTDEELQEYHQVAVDAVAAVLEHCTPDILHANHVVYQPTIAAEACARTGTPYVVYPHGSAIEYTVRADPRFVPLAEHGLQSSCMWITGNQEVRDRLITLFPHRREDWLRKHEIVGVGVDTNLFRPVPRDARAESIAALDEPEPTGKSPQITAELHERLDAGEFDAVTTFRDRYAGAEADQDYKQRLQGVPWGHPILLFVGSLTSGKGVQSLIVAFAQLLESHPDAQLVIVGNGSYREVLEALVHGLATNNEPLVRFLTERGMDLDRSELTGPWSDIQAVLDESTGKEALFRPGARVSEQVHFVGRLHHDRLCRVFPCADVAVFPSVIPEAYPLVMMESLSNGVRPAVSDFSGFADGLRELEGLLGSSMVEPMRLPTGDDERIPGMTRALDRLLAQPADDTTRTRLRTIAVEHFDWSIRAREMSRAYARAVERASKSG